MYHVEDFDLRYFDDTNKLLMTITKDSKYRQIDSNEIARLLCEFSNSMYAKECN